MSNTTHFAIVPSPQDNTTRKNLVISLYQFTCRLLLYISLRIFLYSLKLENCFESIFWTLWAIYSVNEQRIERFAKNNLKTFGFERLNGTSSEKGAQIKCKK